MPDIFLNFFLENECAFPDYILEMHNTFSRPISVNNGATGSSFKTMIYCT